MTQRQTLKLATVGAVGSLDYHKTSNVFRGAGHDTEITSRATKAAPMTIKKNQQLIDLFKQHATP